MEEEGANSRTNFSQPGEDDAAQPDVTLDRERPSELISRVRPNELKDGEARQDNSTVLGRMKILSRWRPSRDRSRANELKDKALKRPNESLISLGRSDRPNTTKPRPSELSHSTTLCRSVIGRVEDSRQHFLRSLDHMSLQKF